jgi:D-sedoheptulose 7-phosphate isomerase
MRGKWIEEYFNGIHRALEALPREVLPQIMAQIEAAASESGNSPNVLEAVLVAREAGAFAIGLTGFEGGQLRDLVDLCLIVPSACMEQIEDLHLILQHTITTVLRRTWEGTAVAAPILNQEPLPDTRHLSGS